MNAPKEIFFDTAKPPSKDCFDSGRLRKNVSGTQEITFNDEQLPVQCLVGGIQACLAAAALFLSPLGRVV